MDVFKVADELACLSRRIGTEDFDASDPKPTKKEEAKKAALTHLRKAFPGVSAKEVPALLDVMAKGIIEGWETAASNPRVPDRTWLPFLVDGVDTGDWWCLPQERFDGEGDNDGPPFIGLWDRQGVEGAGLERFQVAFTFWSGSLGCYVPEVLWAEGSFGVPVAITSSPVHQHSSGWISLDRACPVSMKDDEPTEFIALVDEDGIRCVKVGIAIRAGRLCIRGFAGGKLFVDASAEPGEANRLDRILGWCPMPEAPSYKEKAKEVATSEFLEGVAKRMRCILASGESAHGPADGCEPSLGLESTLEALPAAAPVASVSPGMAVPEQLSFGFGG